VKLNVLNDLSLLARRHSQFVLILIQCCLVEAEVFTALALAETWVCPRQGQADLYLDHGMPGCRQLGEAKTYSPLEIVPATKSPGPIAGTPAVSSAAIPGAVLQSQHKKPTPFPEISLYIPVLGIGQTKVGSITGSWAGLVAQLIVGYKADGKGPEILPDSNLMPVSVYSLHTAVTAATEAVGYDPRYLSVRLLVPTPLDGPSAGGIFAVGVAAALLGDPIRQDVCMSGTIEPDHEIRPVGRLVDKMNACRDLRKTTMIVPDGQDNSHLNFTGAERSIQVIEIHTLAEAYNAATGQALRQVP
jgi:Lon protease (S16) C-terminal proteolytic domain